MNKRPYEIKSEEKYNNLVKRANELTKEEGRYWTVIWHKIYKIWWITYMPNGEDKLQSRM